MKDTAKDIFIKICLILLVITLGSCHKEEFDGQTVIHLTLPAGEKECGNPIKMHNNTDYHDVAVYVDHTWEWTEDSVHHSYGGIAKFVGYSEGMWHRNNSIRIGWKHEYGVGSFWLFRETNHGVYKSVRLPMDVEIPKWYNLCLAEEGDDYVLRCYDVYPTAECRVPIYKDRYLGYMLWVSMAGSYRVWHDWDVRLIIKN